MTEVTGIKEGKGKPEMVKLGQRFHLFGPEKNSILLELPFIASSIPITANLRSIERQSTALYSSISIVPFDPEMGYRITTEDADAIKRSKKLDKAEAHNSDPKQELSLLSLKSFSDSPLFTKEDISKMKNLRIQLFFPSSSYEAQVRGDPLKKGELSFDYFYPLDTGPLPQNENTLVGHTYLHKGHWLLLSKDDMNKLSQIEAEFVLATEIHPQNPSIRVDPEINSR